MRCRETLGGLTLWQDSGEFRLGRDSLLLSAFPALHPGDRVCDLGCGVGSLLIALAARQPHLVLDGVELRPAAAELCRSNLAENQLSGTVGTGCLTCRHPELPWGSYELVVANPPYFPAGQGKVSPDPAKRMARTEGEYTLSAACEAAGRLCKNGGRFALCLPPARLAELMVCLRAAGLEPKRLQPVQVAANTPPNLILLEAGKGGKPGLQMLPVLIER